MKDCYCCSKKDFADCCQPFLQGKSKPTTAESLMRSRYSAYVTVNVDYLIKSTHPSTRKFHDADTIKKWAESNLWQKLEIVEVLKGLPTEKEGIVEFKAFYFDSASNLQIHHERSNFQKELGKWFFVDGKIF